LARWRNGAGRGALNVAQRPDPLHSGHAEFGKNSRRQIAERTVRPDGVVIVLPDCQRFADMGKRSEDGLVEHSSRSFAYGICHNGAACSERLVVFDRRVFHRLMLDFGIELSTEQSDDG
jgi:hypothetical protein